MHKVAYDIFKNTQWKDAIANLKDQGLPREFQEFLAGDTAKQANADVEKEFWMGNSDLVGSPTGAGFINGFYKIISDKLTAASKTSQIVALGANEDPTDPTKVQAAFDKIVAAMPKTLVGARAKVRFFVSPLVEQAHRRSLQLQLASNLPNVNPLVHNTYELIVVPNLDDKTIIVGKPENMAIATAVDGDLVEINVVDQFALGLGNFARVFGNFGYGVGAATTDFVIATGTAENN